MPKLRITSRLVLLGLALQLGLRLILWLPVGWGQFSRREMLLGAVRVVGSLCAYGLALVLCWRIADEYREAKWMRFAWLALACNAGLSLLRPFALMLTQWGQRMNFYYLPLEYGLVSRSILVPANFCLLLGVLGIWWAYREIGLGFRLNKGDFLAIVGLLGVMLALFSYSDLLIEAQEYYRITRVLQVIAQSQMVLIAAASLLLHRVAIQMGSGRMAIVLRWLTVYALWRLGLVLAVSLARYVFPHKAPLITGLAAFGWQAAPWLLALAVAYRAELTELAAERVTHIQKERPALAAS